MNERNGTTNIRRPKMVFEPTQTFEDDAFPYPSPYDFNNLLSQLITEQTKTNALLEKIEKLLADGA